MNEWIMVLHFGKSVHVNDAWLTRLSRVLSRQSSNRPHLRIDRRVTPVKDIYSKKNIIVSDKVVKKQDCIFAEKMQSVLAENEAVVWPLIDGVMPGFSACSSSGHHRFAASTKPSK